MKLSKIPFIIFTIFASLYFAISCGPPETSIVENSVSGIGGFSGSAGNIYSYGGEVILNLGGLGGGINSSAGAPEYVLPFDFTKTEFGGYKLGPSFDQSLNEDAGSSTGCGTQILGIVRDFRGFNEVNGHSDFEHFSGWMASPGIVGNILGVDQKPVYSGPEPFIDPTNGQQTTTKVNFDQWYRSVDNVNLSYIVYLYFEPNNNTLTFQSDAFFPLDNSGFGNTPGQINNFSFTTEIHTQFDYKGGENFTFIGDDDVWVFINNRLAVDLGGLHSKLSKSILLDDNAQILNIKVGNNYNLDFFHSERHTSASNFRIDTNLSFTNCGTIIDIIK